MAILNDYIAHGTMPDKAQLDELLAKYPWFELARLIESGNIQKRHRLDIAKITEVSNGEIIERFLRKGNYRIVVDDEGPDTEIVTEASIEDDDDIVSEELAEIYLAQGLKSQSIEIYRKLSLLNTEKSIYFAEKIDAIEKNS